MLEENITLYTDSNFSMLKENKIKGLAMELLIGWTFDKTSHKVCHEEALSKITQQAKNYMKKVYRIKKNFKLVKKSGKEISFGISSKDYNEIILDTNIFIEPCSLEYKTSKKKTRFNYVWDGKWSTCSNCDKFVRTEWLKSKKKKCWVCKKGFFRKNLKKKVRTIKIPYYEKKKFTSFQSLLDYLIKNDFISQVNINTVQNKSRVDLWRIINGKLVFYESKNKEKTQLCYKDMIQALIYGVVLKKANLVAKHINIVFNGYWEDWFMQVVSRWHLRYGLKIKLVPIKQWLENFSRRTNLYIKFLLVCPMPLKSFESVRSSKNSKWYLNIYANKTKSSYEKLELILRESDEEVKKVLSGKGFS